MADMQREELVKKLSEWLGNDGHSFFKNVYYQHGRMDAVIKKDKVMHPIHFREGMDVRNFLRKHVDWEAHKLDDEWTKLVEEAVL